MAGEWIAIVVAALASCCSPVASGPSAASRDLAFDFQLTSGSGLMDQVLIIENRGASGLAPVLEFVPLDASGDPMPGVTVKTGYGSDEGLVVVPPRWAAIDILRFEGSGMREVADVDVRAKSSDRIAIDTPAGDLAVQPLDRRGRPVDLASYFHAYRVTNKTGFKARVRVVLFEWEKPPPGEAQQALRVTQLTPLLTLPPKGKKTMRLPRLLRGRVIGTVKAYHSR